MRLAIIALVLCACVWLATGDVAHLKGAKARLVGRLAKSKHHKRGVLSGVPPFKLGHDIPHVTHSVVKPIVVSYPPTASVTAVKVPLAHPLLPRYPVPVGHKVPVPHPHYGLKFPHHTKAVVLPKPDHHFHHHHHHVPPRPFIPVVPEPVPATPLVSVGQPTATIAHPVPAPPPPVVLPTPVVPQPVPISPPVQILPPHLHLKPVPAPVPVQPAPIVSPVFPLTPQFPYLLRPGNAVQTSIFATYPRYPLVNYQSPLIPLTSTASINQILYNRPQVPHYHLYPQGDAHDGIVIEQPAPAVPIESTPTLLHSAHGEISQPTVHLQPVQPGVHLHSGIHLQPTQPDIHLQPAQPGLHLHPDQAGVHLHAAHPDIHLQPAQPGVHLHHEQPDIHLQTTQPGIQLHSAQPDLHLQPAQPGFNVQPAHPDINLQSNQPGVHLQPTQPSVNLDHNGWSPVSTQPNDISNHPEANFPQTNDAHHHFTQEQGTQVFEHHSGQDHYHDYQHQLQHHIQQQIEQAQYEQHINKQHQLSQEYGVPQNLNQEYGQPNQDYSQHAQEYAQHGQEYAQHAQEYAQHGQEYAQHAQEYAQHGQDYAQHGQEYAQHAQNDYNLSQTQPGQEYGLPQQGAEGRSAPEAEADTQLYHNHIPLGLQPPIDRPLEHFR